MEAGLSISRGHPPDQRENFRARLNAWIESQSVQSFIIALICINGVVLGLETSDWVLDRTGGFLPLLNQAILVVFVIEIGLRLIAQGPWFFRGAWNNFDFFVVAVSLIPDGGAFSVLRALRVLRILRLLSTVSKLRQIVESLLLALPGIGWVAVLLGLIFYVFAVMGTELYGDAFPEWFGHVGLSMYTLFQVMTLESWSEAIARPVMEAHPSAWLYFVSFILVSAFTVLNLFIGIIVNSMQSLHWEEEDEKRQASEQKAHDERQALVEEIRRLSAQVDRLEQRLQRDRE